MIRKTKSYNVQIWLGTREGYTDVVHTYEEAQNIIDEIVNSDGGYCVSITKTEFRYYDGWEEGIVIGLINYPRYPKEEDDILIKAIEIANKFKDIFKQEKITITAPDKTLMIY